MIIREIEIISFGKFKNKTIKFSEGLNIIYGNNESGKSTIIDFIYTILYGFGDNRGKSLSLREKYTPWSGDVCEGRISVKTDDKKIINIYRKAGAVKKYDILRIYDAETGEELSLAPENIIGISSDTFFKTLCIKQLSTKFDGNNDEITRKLSNISSGGDECADYEKAYRILENIRREIQPLRGSGGQLHSIKQRISNAEKSALTYHSRKSELNQIQSMILDAEAEVLVLKNDYEKLSNEDFTVSAEHIKDRIHPNLFVKKNSSFHLAAYLPSLFMLLVTFLTRLFFDKTITAVLLVLSIVCIIAAFCSEKNIAKQLSGEKNRLEEKKLHHEQRLTLLKSRLAEAESNLSNLKFKENILSSTLAQEVHDTDNLYKKKHILETKLKAVSLAADALKAAHEQMQRDFTPAINKLASEYFSRITGGKYPQIFCNENIDVQIESKEPRPIGYFSGGTVDQLYLSVRLALIDMLFQESSCTLILDQPFLQYDHERKMRTVDILNNLKNKRQILIFTSDKNLISTNKVTEMLT